MPAFFQNGVLNEGNTPAAKTGTVAARPAATAVSEGTIYIAYDTQEIFTSQGGNWVSLGGGGGGSQNLAQVLAVGNNANGQLINLNTNLYSKIQSDNTFFDLVLTNDANGPTQSGFGVQGVLNSILSVRADRTENNSSDFEFLEYQTDLSKNTLTLKSNFISTLGIDATVLFECKAGVVNRQTAQWIDLNSNNQNEIVTRCEGVVSTKWETNDVTNANLRRAIISPERIEAYLNGNTTQINFNIPAGGLTIDTPDFSGTMANVNERILGSNVDLSLSTQNVNGYGVYRIITGSPTNFLNFDNFINNAVDGMFVTLMVADTPVKCQNTIGNIIGTPNINSKGLYKLMKYGNDLFTSHI